MAQIQFRGKIRTVKYVDDVIAYQYIPVPELDRKHCDMAAFRTHKKYGSYSNSDLFRNILARIRHEIFKGDRLKLHEIPAGVQVDASGFLAIVTIDV